MALLLTSLSSPLTHSNNNCVILPSTISYFSLVPTNRLSLKPLNQKSLHGIQCKPLLVKQNLKLVVKASAEIDGAGEESGGAPIEAEEASVPIENLPLESKVKEKMEQKLRMKLAKKLRLRRNRLVRKRQLRKKGRWPPSKMKKNKNV